MCRHMPYFILVIASPQEARQCLLLRTLQVSCSGAASAGAIWNHISYLVRICSRSVKSVVSSCCLPRSQRTKTIENLFDYNFLFAFQIEIHGSQKPRNYYLESITYSPLWFPAFRWIKLHELKHILSGHWACHCSTFIMMVSVRTCSRASPII